MNRRNRVAFFNILSTVLLRGISIFTAPLFTRLLGTSGYGVTQIYNTWVAVIAIVFTLQTQGTLVNARVEYPEGDQLRYQSSAMSLSTLVYLIFSALVLCFIGPISGALKLSWFLIVLMLIQGFGTFCVNFLNTKFVYEFKAGRNMVMSLVVTLTTLILSIVLILLLPKQINYLGRISAIAVTYGVLGIPVCIWILAKGKTFYNKEYWKFCVVLAIPTVFYNLSDLILGQSDKVMLQQMMDEATVGCYGAALNFGGIMFTLFTALNNSWCPFFFEDMKRQPGESAGKGGEFSGAVHGAFRGLRAAGQRSVPLCLCFPGFLGKHHAHSHFCVQLLHQFPVYLPGEFRVLPQKDKGRLDHHHCVVADKCGAELPADPAHRHGRRGGGDADFPQFAADAALSVRPFRSGRERIPLPAENVGRVRGGVRRCGRGVRGGGWTVAGALGAGRGRWPMGAFADQKAESIDLILFPD